MESNKNITNNLVKNYITKICCAGLFLMLYHCVVLIATSFYYTGFLNQNPKLNEIVPLSLLSVLFEIVLIVGLVIINLVISHPIRQLCSIAIYIISFSLLYFVFKHTFVDLVIFYLTIVWVESTIFNDYEDDCIV